MNAVKLTSGEQTILLNLARQSITAAIKKLVLPDIQLDSVSSSLASKGASFVTLTKNSNLRGCIGTLEAYQPLIKDVQEHAIAAALQDYRFDQVREVELPLIKIEISRLTEPAPFQYESIDDLLNGLRPNIDGVILKDGMHKATFLPQVWEQLPQPEDFLSHLCNKMGASPTFWKERKLTVSIYQVEEFHD